MILRRSCSGSESDSGSSIRKYDASRPFGAWARAIAYYLVLEFRKERSRQRVYFTEHIVELLDETYASAAADISSSRSVLVDCLGKLPKDKYTLVTTYYQKDGPATLATLVEQDSQRNPAGGSPYSEKHCSDCVQRNLGASS